MEDKTIKRQRVCGLRTFCPFCDKPNLIRISSGYCSYPEYGCEHLNDFLVDPNINRVIYTFKNPNSDCLIKENK
jgi:hypothetical protein